MVSRLLLLLCVFLLPASFVHASCHLRLGTVALDQFGYPNAATKIAVIADPQTGADSATDYTPPATLTVRSASDGSLVYSAAPTAMYAGAEHVQSGNKIWWYDFSSVTTSGDYYLLDSTLGARSDTFTIGPSVYTTVLRHALRMFYYQRAGFAKTTPYADARWTEGASYLGTGQDSEARDITDPTNAATAKDLRGGWYDAGDTNKYTPYGAQAVNTLLLAYELYPAPFTDDMGLPESGNGLPDILDEVKVELDWLLRMQVATGNGSVLCKNSLPDTAYVTSPPSADTRARYWGSTSTTCTAKAAAAFAHGAIVFAAAGESTYAATLTTAAGDAWTWAAANPSTDYANTGFTTVNPDPGGTYTRTMARIEAAVYLYALTGTAAYRTFVDANYTTAQPMVFTYWYGFEASIEEALLYYTTVAGATGATVTAIQNSKTASIGGGEFLAAYTANTDAYRAYMKDADYVFGSNKVKAEIGNLYFDMIAYNLDSANHASYRAAGAGYLHYLHGTNPNGLVYLSHMGAYGAERSANEVYHVWFWDGTVWDNALTSANGPAPGYLTGGVNTAYTGTGLPAPPAGQPVQKTYWDNNAGYPQNSWEFSEAGIYYQAAYIRLLAAMIP